MPEVYIVLAEGCQPTYEELKLEQLQGFFGEWGRCQPTYEELKQANDRNEAERKAMDVSLPMRN